MIEYWNKSTILNIWDIVYSKNRKGFACKNCIFFKVLGILNILKLSLVFRHKAIHIYKTLVRSKLPYGKQEELMTEV
jgi:hypothetical protein